MSLRYAAMFGLGFIVGIGYGRISPASDIIHDSKAKSIKVNLLSGNTVSSAMGLCLGVLLDQFIRQ